MATPFNRMCIKLYHRKHKTIKELTLLLYDLKKLRESAMAFVSSQSRMTETQARWGSATSNLVIEQVSLFAKGMNIIWIETQVEFFEQLDQLRNNYKILLRAEKSLFKDHQEEIDLAADERKVMIQIEAAGKQGTDTSKFETKLISIRSQIAKLKKEVPLKEIHTEGETLRQFKSFQHQITEFYVKLINNHLIIFNGQSAIAHLIPDVDPATSVESDIEAVKHFDVSAQAKNILMDVLNNVSFVNLTSREQIIKLLNAAGIIIP